MRAWASMLLFVLAAVNLDAQAGYSVSGQVLINEEGVLYVYLADEEQFPVPFTGIESLIFEISSAQLAEGVVRFAFHSIPAGRYGIRVFVDTNRNGKLDRGLFGPNEPWGMSWQGERVIGIPRFDKVAFRLDGNISGMEIDSRR